MTEASAILIAGAAIAVATLGSRDKWIEAVVILFVITRCL